MANYYDFDGSVKCAHCQYRYSWDCDDGLRYPEHGCEDFALDDDTFSDECKELLVLLRLLGGNPDV